MKRTERVASITKILTDSPSKVFQLQYFCNLFDAAKSSISEDIQAASAALEFTGSGHLETIPGARGGVRFVPCISDAQLSELKEDFCRRLSVPQRLVGGNFLYTSDLFGDPYFVDRIARYFAMKFSDRGADYVITVETKGIPLAAAVSHYLNLPLVIIRREARISEGSTISINYFSGSSDRIQKMSMSKRAIEQGSKVLVIDDFLRGGGTIVGIEEMVREFGGTVVGVGVAIASREPEKKKVSDYNCLVRLGEVSQSMRTIEAYPEEE